MECKANSESGEQSSDKRHGGSERLSRFDRLIRQRGRLDHADGILFHSFGYVGFFEAGNHGVIKRAVRLDLARQNIKRNGDLVERQRVLLLLLQRSLKLLLRFPRSRVGGADRLGGLENRAVEAS